MKTKAKSGKIQYIIVEVPIKILSICLAYKVY